MGTKSRPTGGPHTLSDVYQSQIDKNKVLASFVLALSTLRRCNLTVKTVVFKDFHFVTLVAFAYHLITRRLQKRLQNRSLRCSKTVPKRCSKSHASWKRFRDEFGTIFDSQMASQKRSLRRPRGHQKRLLFNLASREASRMDFGSHLDPLRLVFEQCLEVIWE